MLAAPRDADILQFGAYTLPQAAQIARIHARTVGYWFDEDPARGPAIRRHMPANEEDLISFIDLIQLLGVHVVRNKHRVSLQKIRQAVRKAEERGISYQIASNSARAYLWGDEIVLRTDDGDFVQATGKNAKA